MDDHSQDLPTTMPFHRDSVLPTSDRWLRWGSLALLGSCGLGFGLINTLSVDVTVRAYGQVRPTEPPYSVAMPQSGTIAKLHVSENDAIMTGQVIADLYPHDTTVEPQAVEPSTPASVKTAQSIYAPVNGYVLRLSKVSPGQMIQTGMVIAEIMPSSQTLVARVVVPPAEIGQIAVNQSVQMQIAAYPYPEYGTLPGTITTISPDVVPCQFSNCTIPEGYRVDVELGQAHMESNATSRRYELQPGMPVTADIVTHRAKLITLILNKLRLTSR